MPIVEAALTLNAPQNQLFALAQSYTLRLEWDPFLRAMQFLEGATEAAVGVHVRVKAKNRLTMEVEYTTVEPPERVAMKMVKGPFFFESFAGTWRFERRAANLTEVRFRYSFKTRWPILRPLFDPIIRQVFLRDIRARLQGLKQSAESTDILERLTGEIKYGD